MARFLDTAAIADRPLSTETYHALQRVLVKTGEAQGGHWVTEASCEPVVQELIAPWQTFTLVVTDTVQGLLIQRPRPEAGAIATDVLCWVALVSDPQTIATFADILLAHPAMQPAMQPEWRAVRQRLSDRDPQSSGRLTLDLLVTALEVSRGDRQEARATETSLAQQVEQNLLLSQVINKIRQSLDLEEILATTVAEVRQSLNADRLLIYQFKAGTVQPSLAVASTDTLPSPLGQSRYESLSSSHVPAVIDFHETDWLDVSLEQGDADCQGRPIAIADVTQLEGAPPKVVNFFQKARVRSQVIAPIGVQGKLWGVLVAHQCVPREWQPQELTFLQHIAEHLAIAIRQAELYHQLQTQAQSLESCVIERTQNLRDALAAAQAANLAKSEFLTTMSHELRTPLTCIIGMSATLLRWSFGDLSPRQRDYLNTIHTSGERLLTLINDILEVAKIEAGRTVLEISSFSLNTLAQHCLESFREQARDRNIDLNFESTLLPAQDTFVGDPRRIQQVLSNLLSNALKFTEHKGRVTLRVRRDGQTAVFQIEDTGIGIHESHLPLLFEKFQQLEDSRRRQYQGTGLGLALTKQLVELHGGTISVNSRLDVGSVFTVRLPAQRLPSDAAAIALDNGLESIPGRIVLVEDHEDTAGIICDLLTAAGYQVIWVIEGSQVVEQVALLQPTVVIISLHLSGVEGRHVIQALRDSLVTNHVKILAITAAHEADAEALSSEVLSADAILSHPINPEQLLEQVNALIAIATP